MNGKHATGIVVCTLAWALLGAPAAAQQIRWVNQFGGTGQDNGKGIDLRRSGDLLVGGFTSAGDTIFVKKLDRTGFELWSQETAASIQILGGAVAADTPGNVFVAGQVFGTVDGQPNAGDFDMFLKKYNRSGVAQWTRTFGTAFAEKGPDGGSNVFADRRGHVYIVGTTFGGTLPGQTFLGARDAFIRKYDGGGNELWTRQFGTSADDNAESVVGDNTGIYVGGRSVGIFSGQSSNGAYVRKYDEDGGVLWTRQFTSGTNDSAFGVALDDSGNVYVTGRADGALPGQTNLGSSDAFLRKYDGSGNELWTRQFGSSSFEFGGGVSVDASGAAFVTGYTSGAFPGQTNAGSQDFFVAAYDSAGNPLFATQWGTSGTDRSEHIAVIGDGTVDSDGDLIPDPVRFYIVGETEGDLLGQTSAGSDDAFVLGAAVGDNCPLDSNPGQADADGDGGGDACDCDDIDPTIYPGAPEINDGLDNQCPGDPGAGAIDEISAMGKFDTAAEFCWGAQAGATTYEVARSTNPSFTTCTITTTSATCASIPDPPTGLYYVLVRPIAPNVGSWGTNSSGIDRPGICP